MKATDRTAFCNDKRCQSGGAFAYVVAAIKVIGQNEVSVGITRSLEKEPVSFIGYTS